MTIEPWQWRCARAALQLTQHQVSARCGISRHTIHRIESGSSALPVMVQRLVSFYAEYGLTFAPNVVDFRPHNRTHTDDSEDQLPLHLGGEA